LTKDVSCSVGEKASGGGGSTSGNGALTFSVPLKGSNVASTGDTPDGWRATDSGGGSHTLSVYVVCVS
jgi:hypothetical protein